SRCWQLRHAEPAADDDASNPHPSVAKRHWISLCTYVHEAVKGEARLVLRTLGRRGGRRNSGEHLRNAGEGQARAGVEGNPGSREAAQSRKAATLSPIQLTI